MIRIAAVFALLAAPAAAQDIAYSNAPVETCLAAAKTISARRECIGVSASECTSGKDGDTTIGLGFCFDSERAFWDGMLNANYKRAITEAKASDKAYSEIDPFFANQQKSLRDMQRAWITYRDASCVYESGKWGNGSGRGPATYYCLMTLTGLQALAIETELP